MAHHEPVADRLDNLALARNVAYLFAAFFVLAGILGFIPGAVTGHDTMTFSGHESDAMLFGVFEVSVLHNIVHLVFGVAGLVLARTVRGARAFLIGGGIVYLLLWIYGLVIDKGGSGNFCRSTPPTTGCTSGWASRWSCSAWPCGHGSAARHLPTPSDAAAERHGPPARNHNRFGPGPDG